jgi:hypothetical protein
LLDYGVAFNYRCGRYDCTGLFLVAVAAYGATCVRSLRLPAIFLACLAMPAAGVQVALYMGIVLLFALSVFRREALPTVIAGASGLAVGVAMLLGVLSGLGVLDAYLAAVDRQRNIVDGRAPKDPSFWLLLLATIVQMVQTREQGWWRQPVLLFLASVGFLAPPFIYAAGRFPTYYTWMSVFPLSALLFTLIEKYETTANRFRNWLVAGLITTGCLLGLPLQLTSGAFYWRERRYEEVRRVVGPVVADDVVIADPAAYYAIRPKAAKTYLAEYVSVGQWMNEKQFGRVNLMVIRPEQFHVLAKLVGGAWQPGAKSPPARGILPLFAPGFGDQLIATYDLQAFRRVPDAR